MGRWRADGRRAQREPLNLRRHRGERVVGGGALGLELRTPLLGGAHRGSVHVAVGLEHGGVVGRRLEAGAARALGVERCRRVCSARAMASSRSRSAASASALASRIAAVGAQRLFARLGGARFGGRARTLVGVGDAGDAIGEALERALALGGGGELLGALGRRWRRALRRAAPRQLVASSASRRRVRHSSSARTVAASRADAEAARSEAARTSASAAASASSTRLSASACTSATRASALARAAAILSSASARRAAKRASSALRPASERREARQARQQDEHRRAKE
jgi:hypothetical protein